MRKILNSKIKKSAILFKIINKLPIFFSDSNKFYAQEFSSKEYLISNKYEKISFFTGDFKWKAVNVFIEINNNEMKQFYNWFKNIPSESYKHQENTPQIFDTKFKNGDSYRSIGWISINNLKLRSILRMKIPKSLSDKCYITLDKLENGFNFINLYFLLVDEATNKIKNIDITNLKNSAYYDTINPFSKKRNIIKFKSIEDKASIIIEENVKEVIDNIYFTTRKILDLWNIKKEFKELIIISDFFTYKNSKYFCEENIKNYTNKEMGLKKHIAYIAPYERHLEFGLPTDKNEHLCRLRGKNIILNFIDIECGIYKDEITNSSSENIAFSTTNSHISYSFILNSSENYYRILDKLDLIINKENLGIDKVHKIIIKSEYLIQRLEEKLEAIKKRYTNHNSNIYSKHILEIANNQENLTKDLKNSVISRKTHSTDNIQIENLKFHKNYSWIVGILIIVQILIAGVQIYTSKTETTTNKIFIVTPRNDDSTCIKRKSHNKVLEMKSFLS